MITKQPENWIHGMSMELKEKRKMKKLETNKVYQGNSLDVLKTFPDESIDMCITSPPYWGLRDYGTEGQIWNDDESCEHEWEVKTKKMVNAFSETGIRGKKRDSMVSSYETGFCKKCNAWKGELGLEPEPDMFVDHLCEIFDEVKRVLKSTGTCFVNLGDTYSGGGGCGTGEYSKRHTQFGKVVGNVGQSTQHKAKNIPSKSLCMIPSRFGIEMINRGWLLRNEIIWHKPSCLPASVKDRYTVDFEKMFFFTKNKSYYFKQQLEPMVSEPHSPGNKFNEAKVSGPNDRGGASQWDDTSRVWGDTGSKDRRKQAKELLDKDIANGTVKIIASTERPHNKVSEYEELVREYCQRLMSSSPPNPEGRNKRTVWSINPSSFKDAHFATYPPVLLESPIDAGCPEDGIVLDIFMGSGTTAEVAMKQDKNWVGIDLNPEYIKISDKRLAPTIKDKKTREKASEFWE